MDGWYHVSNGNTVLDKVPFDIQHCQDWHLSRTNINLCCFLFLFLFLVSFFFFWFFIVVFHRSALAWKSTPRSTQSMARCVHLFSLCGVHQRSNQKSFLTSICEVIDSAGCQILSRPSVKSWIVPPFVHQWSHDGASCPICVQSALFWTQFLQLVVSNHFVCMSNHFVCMCWTEWTRICGTTATFHCSQSSWSPISMVAYHPRTRWP